MGVNFSDTGYVNLNVTSEYSLLSRFTGKIPVTGGLRLPNGDLIRYHSLRLIYSSRTAMTRGLTAP